MLRKSFLTSDQSNGSAEVDFFDLPLFLPWTQIENKNLKEMLYLLISWSQPIAHIFDHAIVALWPSWVPEWSSRKNPEKGIKNYFSWNYLCWMFA
jgi:hypothetical protein